MFFKLLYYFVLFLNELQSRLAAGGSSSPFQNLPQTLNNTNSQFLRSLLHLGNLQTVLKYIEGWIFEAERFGYGVNDLKTTYSELGRELQSSEMHIFLACWTLWDFEGTPRIIDLLMRTPTLKSFLSMVSPKYLGTIYLVSRMINNFFLLIQKHD
jgi:hypothetical protein